MKPETWIAQHPGKPRAYVRPLRVWLNPEHGAQLRRLSSVYDLTWATTWADDANTFISPVLGLPTLPVVGWPSGRRDHSGEHSWKIEHLLAHAAGRPFAWIDDELGDADRILVAEHHGGPTLLRHVSPRAGLGTADFFALSAFAEAL